MNLLVYAANIDAPQRAMAASWLEKAFDDPAGIGFAWHALAGFLRLSTRRRILPQPLQVETALGVVDEWLSHPRVRILAPTDRHAAVLGRLLVGAGRGGNLVSDAQLAAIAIEHGAVLGTFDADFEQFAGLRFEHLSAPAVHES